MMNFDNKELRIAIWGIGRKCRDFILERNLPWDNISCLIDADSNLWGKSYAGYKITAPERVDFTQIDRIVIITDRYREEIKNLITRKGFPEEFIWTGNQMLKYFPEINLNKVNEQVFIWGGWNEAQDIAYLMGCREPIIVTSEQVNLSEEFIYVDNIDIEAEEHFIRTFHEKPKGLIVLCTTDQDKKREFLENEGLYYWTDYISASDLMKHYDTAVIDDTNPYKPSDMYELMRNTPKLELSTQCRNPFENIEIHHSDGDIRTCCPKMMPVVVGKLSKSTYDEISKGILMRFIRLSVLNGTYAYCVKDQCPYLINNGMCDKHEVSYSEESNFDINLCHANVSIDYSCNLSCPSCRKTVRYATGEERKKIDNVADKVIKEVFPKIKILEIAGDGEIFFSPTYRRMLFDGNEIYDHLSVDLLSNATKFNIDDFEKLERKFESICGMFSIDAASKETYERIRRGASFETMRENMKRIGELRKNGRIKRLQLNYVMQKNTVFELPQFIEWAHEINADSVILQQLLGSISWTKEDYNSKRLVDGEGYLKEEYTELFRENWTRDSIINWSNFTYAIKEF